MDAGSGGLASNASPGAGKAIASQLPSVQEQQHAGLPRERLGTITTTLQKFGPNTFHSTLGSFVPSHPSGIFPPPEPSASQPPPLAGPALQSPYMAMGPVSHMSNRISGVNELLGDQGQTSTKAKIPFPIDWESGSRTQDEKRERNRRASEQSRGKSKMIAILQEKVSQLNKQIQSLTEQRDFYRNERDIYKRFVSEGISSAAMPPRPHTPTPLYCYSPSTACRSDQPSTAIIAKKPLARQA